MLVGELHGHSAAERLADYGGVVDVEDVEEITDPAGERTQRVVPDRLLRQTVTHEVRRDHGEATRQVRDDVPPGPRTAGDAVEKQQRGSAAFPSVRHVVTMDRDVLDIDCHGTSSLFR